MRKFGKMAAAVAAAGLAALATVAAGGGAASAATHKSGVTFSVGQSVTGCNTGSNALLAPDVFPTCTSPDSTVVNPTSFTLTADPSFFSTVSVAPGIDALLILLGQSLSENITYTLACSVNGQTATFDGTFVATKATQSTTVDLQSAVGSPVPNNCKVENLKATSLVSLSTPLRVVLGVNRFTFGVTATATTGLSGAVYLNSGTTSKGAGASTCLDDANNGNAGSKIQAFQCNSDLAQFWVQSNDGQIVRNGVCLTQNAHNATLAKCSPTNNAQKWIVNSVGGSFKTVINHSTSQCLTMASPKNFSQITVTPCTGAGNQNWAAPAKSPDGAPV